MKKIRILQIIPSLSQSNGVAAYISEYFQHMDKKNIDMTFLVLNNKNHDRYAEIERNGNTNTSKALYKSCKSFLLPNNTTFSHKFNFFILSFISFSKGPFPANRRIELVLIFITSLKISSINN